MLRPIPVPAVLGILVWALLLPALAQEEEGLFADFETSQGEFSCRLDFQRTPRTVANFVALAEGTRPWVDFQKGAVVRRPYYQGTTFHRVIKDFMIQGGSPNGRGTDGPGYFFADEFHPQLRHSREGILSMANSSNPNTNGSQFFVTVSPASWLDNRHTVFGWVSRGMEVVRHISLVPTGEDDRPVNPVALHRVAIRRTGAAALAFDPLAVVPPLPQVEQKPLRVYRGESTLEMSWPTRSQAYYMMFHSSDLARWSYQVVSAPAVPTGSVTFDSFLRSLPHSFFFVVESPYDLLPAP